MKRFLLFTLVIGLFAVQADAGLWTLDQPTAVRFTSESLETGSQTLETLSVYDSPTNKVYGPGPAEFGLMSGVVGFFGGLTGDVGAPTYGGDAQLKIYDAAPVLTTDGVAYGGITSYFQNDNQSKWSVQLYYVDLTDGGVRTSAWAELTGLGGHTFVTAFASGATALDLGNITEIGVRILGENMGNPTDATYPSYSDDFHFSVVPVPGAILLGMLGLSVAGLKLRKHA